VRRQCRVLLCTCDAQAATGLVRCGAVSNGEQFAIVEVVQDDSSGTA
jgi:hypothetical protein